MRNLHGPVLCLTTLSLLGGVALAHAAPAKRGPTARSKRVPVVCASGVPTKTQCLSAGYLDACTQHTNACRSHVEDAFTAFRASPAYKKARTAKMLRPHKDAIPQALRTGKEFPYVPPTRTRRAPSANGIAARTKLTGPVLASSADTAKNAHRNKAWEKNGDRVKTCEEYAYEQVYDWARFVDASAACRGDWRCQIDLAYMRSTPGIADRTLRRKDGRPLAEQVKQKRGPVPKNAMFQLDNELIIRNIVLSGGRSASTGNAIRLEETADRRALIQQLDQGNKHYRFGCKGPSCGPREYDSEFAFHKARYDEHRTVSMAEFEEFERRKAKFNRLLMEWSAAVSEEIEASDPKKKRPVHELVLPLDPLVNPYDTNGIVRFALKNSIGGKASKTRTKKSATPKATPTKKGPATKKRRRGERLERKRKRRRRRGALNESRPAPSSVFAAPAKSAGRVSRKNRNAGPAKIPNTKPGKVDVCKSWKLGSGRERDGVGAHSCRLGQFLREEWQRMAAGEISCLDFDHTICDWSPMLFQRRFVESAPILDTQATYEQDCNDWQPTVAKVENASTGKKERPTSAQLEARIRDTKKKAKEALQKLQPYTHRSGDKIDNFGRSFREADSWGDKDWLAVGYEANFNWNVEAIRKDNAACELSGQAGGSFEVNGDVRRVPLSLIGGGVNGTLNRNGNKSFEVDRTLTVFGQSVLPGTASGSLVYAPEPIVASSPRFPSPKPNFNVDVMGFQITGSAWAEAHYGVEFKAEAVLDTPKCDLNEVEFGIETSVEPSFAFHGFAQVGIGIGGLASAGVRGMVNLITLSTPVDASLTTRAKPDGNTNLDFGVGLDMALGTLSGKLMLYVEAFLAEETFTLFSWSGITVRFPLMKPLETSLPLVAWD